MKLTTTPAAQPVVMEQAITVDGVAVGEIHENQPGRGGARFHAVIRLDRVAQLGGATLGINCGSLAQGHGDTAEDAVREAFAQSRADAAAYLSALSHLAELMEVA
jgi:hypothetical protein